MGRQEWRLTMATTLEFAEYICGQIEGFGTVLRATLMSSLRHKSFYVLLSPV
jgi:hypothetical protein